MHVELRSDARRRDERPPVAPARRSPVRPPKFMSLCSGAPRRRWPREWRVFGSLGVCSAWRWAGAFGSRAQPAVAARVRDRSEVVGLGPEVGWVSHSADWDGVAEEAEVREEPLDLGVVEDHRETRSSAPGRRRAGRGGRTGAHPPAPRGRAERSSGFDEGERRIAVRTLGEFRSLDELRPLRARRARRAAGRRARDVQRQHAAPGRPRWFLSPDRTRQGRPRRMAGAPFFFSLERRVRTSRAARRPPPPRAGGGEAGQGTALPSKKSRARAAAERPTS